MPFDPNNFLGLHQEDDSAAPDGYLYIAGLGEHVGGGGTLECLHAPNSSHPTEWTAECQYATNLTVSGTCDLSAAAYWSTLHGTDVTVAERGALAPHPAYVQIGVSLHVDTLGGTTSCPPYSSGTGCNPNVDGTIAFDVTTGCGAEFPWDAGHEFTKQSRFLPGGSTGVIHEDTGILGSGYGGHGGLTRDADALSYTGDPTNTATSTLIPWSVFIADPSLAWQAALTTVWKARVDPTASLAVVRLWFANFYVPAGDGRISFLNGA